MLTAPLVTQQGEVIGVLQLINKKQDTNLVLASPSVVESSVVPFDDGSEQLVATLAAQAGIALENALLYAEIRELFEGFVHASVSAMEQRDPTTSGHSKRVADLTVNLAKAVERVGEGPYKDVTWTTKDLRELEYASLLHEFGKIGVREQVLGSKRRSSTPASSTVSAYASTSSAAASMPTCSVAKCGSSSTAPPRTSSWRSKPPTRRQRKDVEAAWEAISTANEPTVLMSGDFAKIEALSRETYTDLCGHPKPLLDKDEVLSLSVTRGSLTASEIDEIRSHVVHTEAFLRNIPWGTALRNVPTIKDHASKNLLLWFLNEHMEEEKTVRDMLDRLKLAGNDPASLLVLDREAGTRKTAPDGGGAEAA